MSEKTEIVLTPEEEKNILSAFTEETTPEPGNEKRKEVLEVQETTDKTLTPEDKADIKTTLTEVNEAREDKRKGNSGRHPKPCNKGADGGPCDKCKAAAANEPKQGKESKQGPAKTTAAQKAEKTLFDEFSEYQETPTGPKPTGPTPTGPQPQPTVPEPPKLDASKFISGTLFLMVLDAAFPVIIVNLVSYLEPKYNYLKASSRKKLKLTEDEKKELKPAADELVKYIFQDANPVLVATVMIGFVYYAKLDAMDDEDFNFPRPKPAPNKKQRK